MDNFPSALVIASYDSVCSNNNVLYRLVRPLPDGVGVQSTDRLVNVVPFRRKYIFDKKQQLDEFGQQILRRPLVLQPVLHFGRGFGHNCALSYQDELWLVMVNQTHPKILSRLQMGLDSAKGAIERGQPFEIRFRFGKLIQRVYREHLSQKERGEAQKSNSAFSQCMTHFRYAEWEHCDLHLRYHGYGAYINRTSALHSLPNLEVKWDFEDIGMHEMEWRQPTGEVYPRPHLSAVNEDEIRECLPAWTINSVSPLDNIGDTIPENNYDYAQAGRLYASFRKKRAPRHRVQHDARSTSSQYVNDYVGDEEGAVGFDPSVNPDFVDPDDNPVDHNFGYHDDDTHAPLASSRQVYSDTGYPNLEQDLPSNYDGGYLSSDTQPQPKRSNYARPQLTKKFVASETQLDKHGHIHANVQIISHEPSQKQTQIPLYDALNPSSSDYHFYNDTFKKQDSDRFSRSTNADSGYCPDGDEIYSRAGPYDYNDQNCIPRLKKDWPGYENFPHKNGLDNDMGQENPGFSYDYPNTISGLKKQELFDSNLKKDSSQVHTKKMLADSPSDRTFSQTTRALETLSSKIHADTLRAPARKKVAAPRPHAVPQVAESFI